MHQVNFGWVGHATHHATSQFVPFLILSHFNRIKLKTRLANPDTYIAFLYLLQVTLLFLIRVQNLQECLVHFRLTLKPILPNRE